MTVTKLISLKQSLRSNLLVLALSFFAVVNSYSQPISNTYHSHNNIPQLLIERSFIYLPKEKWLYSHHPYICFFKGRYIAMWSNGMKDEDAPGQRVVFAMSKDFKTWSEPKVLAIPSAYNDSLQNVLTAVGFYQYQNTLVAYFGEYSPKRTNTKLWAKTSKDGITWSNAVDMHLPVNANLCPQPLNSGRLLICGNFTFGYTDDKTGLSNWKLTSFYPDSLYKEDNPATFYSPAEKSGLPPLCETSFFQTGDGVIYSLLRVTGKGWKGRLWLTVSKDNGESWSFPEETGFTDNDSKFHFGKLPNGKFYYVGIPDTSHHYDRNPLVLATSADGKVFDKQYIIANSIYHLKKEGLWKGGQYGYPYTFIKDGFMYVIVSRQKEAIEILRFKLDQL